MAKSKKNIDAFQKAMLSNTKMIGNKTSKSTGGAAPKKIQKTSGGEGPELIESQKMKALKEMENKYGIDISVLIDLGLGLFIELEDFWFHDN